LPGNGNSGVGVGVGEADTVGGAGLGEAIAAASPSGTPREPPSPPLQATAAKASRIARTNASRITKIFFTGHPPKKAGGTSRETPNTCTISIHIVPQIPKKSKDFRVYDEEICLKSPLTGYRYNDTIYTAGGDLH